MGTRRKAGPKKPKKEKKVYETMAARIADDIRTAAQDPLAAVTLEDGGRAVVTDVCPTGSLVLDHHVIGVGGLAKGRIYELAGAESAGKTTLACRIMSMAQKDGMQCVFSDKENKFDTRWAAVHGLDLRQVVEYPAPSIEAYHDEILRLIAAYGKKTPLFFCLDSAAALLPQKFLEGGLEAKEVPGAMAHAWSRGLPHLSQAILKSQAILLVLNQLRSKIGVMFGPTEDTPAGRALKHYCTARFMVHHGKTITAAGEGSAKIGRYMSVSAYKNNLWRGGQGAAKLKMLWETGFDDRWSVVDHAKEVGCLESKKDARHYREALENLGWGQYDPEPEKKDGGEG